MKITQLSILALLPITCLANPKPVKVYILAGQSNMLEMGNVSGGNSRHTGFYLSADKDAPKGAEVSVYPGKYNPDNDYDQLDLIAQKHVVYDGMAKDPFPQVKGDATWVARGYIEVKADGEYVFSPGYGNSTYNVTEIDGCEVYRKEPGGEAQQVTKKMVGGKRYPFKTTFFTNAANNLFWVGRTDIPGTLDTVVKKEGKFPYMLGDEGKWPVRDDVFFQDARLHGGWGWEKDDPNQLKLDLAKLKSPAIPLAVGKGVWVGIPFGHLLGDHHDEPVLIIRTAIGNRGLAWDFRPPSSGKLPDVPDNLKKWEGAEYQMMVEGIRKSLEHISEVFPGYKGQGYDLAGFVWFQGHKDGGKSEWYENYEQNLVNLIKDIRKDLKAPDLPVMVATVGFEGEKMPENYKKIRQAQLNVGNPKKHPEFKGRVKTVDTLGFWREKEVSPSGQGYHYNRNAETYMLIGEALGRGMIGLE